MNLVLAVLLAMQVDVLEVVSRDGHRYHITRALAHEDSLGTLPKQSVRRIGSGQWIPRARSITSAKSRARVDRGG